MSHTVDRQDLFKHLLAVHAEGDGLIEINVTSLKQLGSLTVAAMSEDDTAETACVAPSRLLTRWRNQRCPAVPCFTCGNAIAHHNLGAVLTYTGHCLEPEHIGGGLICHTCLAQGAASIRQQASRVLARVGINASPLSHKETT